MNANTAPAPYNFIYADSDTAAAYYETYLSVVPGASVTLKGQYPQARYFSYFIYEGVTSILAHAVDYQIAPDAGSQSPFVSAQNVVSESAGTVNTYTLTITFSAQPASPAPNTLYVDPSVAGSSVLIVYRVYNSFTSNLLGGVPLPAFSGTSANPFTCGFWAFGINVLPPLVNYLDNASATWQIPVAAEPRFALAYKTQNVVSVIENEDNQFAYTNNSLANHDMILVRFKAPTYATEPGAAQPVNVRHWSVCQSSLTSTHMWGCTEDSAATVDANGFVNIVVSKTQVTAPGFNWLLYGPSTLQTGELIYRQQLPAANFAGSFANVPSGQNPTEVIGAYFPLATYCSNSVFTANSGSGIDPAVTFAACTGS
ncbi:MAG: hypothetical protein P4L83_23935 [Nevskia sp.]|nr:hypothetical protein [Nevskia sp.]